MFRRHDVAQAGAEGGRATDGTAVAEPRSGVPVGAWPRVGVLVVAAAGGVAVTKLWWILIVAVVLAVVVVGDLLRSGGRRNLRATDEGLVGVHRGRPQQVAWSTMAGVEFLRPRSVFARPVAHVEVERHDDPYDTAFVTLVIYNGADAEQIGERLKTACERHEVPFRLDLV